MSAIRYAAGSYLALFMLFAHASFVHAQTGKALEAPLWVEAFDLQCRKFGEAEFSKDTKKFGIEAFKDSQAPVGIYISQVGSLAAVDSGFQKLVKPITPSQRPEFTTGLDLPARKAGMKEFTGAATHSMEVFRDLNTDNWVYITEKGYLAATPAKGPKRAGNNAPRLSHSIDLNIRRGGEEYKKDAKRLGVEVYVDQTTGNLVYICETGSIAVIPENPATAVQGEAKDPLYLHGLDLKSRKAAEFAFSKDTKTVGVEVYLDTNNGNIIYITETGTIAVAPGPKNVKAPTVNVQDPKWDHAMNMRCRKVGETEFTDAQAFGVECFRDLNVGVMLFMAETHSLTAVKMP